MFPRVKTRVEKRYSILPLEEWTKRRAIRFSIFRLRYKHHGAVENNATLVEKLKNLFRSYGRNRVIFYPWLLHQLFIFTMNYQPSQCVLRYEPSFGSTLLSDESSFGDKICRNANNV